MQAILDIFSIFTILYLLYRNYVLTKIIEEFSEYEEIKDTIDEDWYFPIIIEYNSNIWYAWDRDNTFILQASSKDELITDILNRYNIPPKRLVIKSEKQIE